MQNKHLKVVFRNVWKSLDVRYIYSRYHGTITFNTKRPGHRPSSVDCGRDDDNQHEDEDGTSDSERQTVLVSPGLPTIHCNGKVLFT